MTYVAKINPVFSKTYPAFSFSGASCRENCYLRVASANGSIVCMVVQPQNYTGTSVTNAIEDIRMQIVALLADESVSDQTPAAVVFEKKEGFLASLVMAFTGAQKAKAQKLVAARKTLIEAIRLVEHYPPGAGLAPEGSFALVTFEPSGEPNWHYMSQPTVTQECGVSPVFFVYP